MKLSVFICFISLLLLSCGGEEPYQPAARKAGATKKAEYEPNDTQSVYHYEPSTSYINGTIVREGHYNRPGFGKTPKIDYKDTVFVVELDHKISIQRTEATDPLSHDRGSVVKMQITSRNDTLRKYVGRRVQIKGLLMEDTTPASYYPIVLILQGIKPME